MTTLDTVLTQVGQSRPMSASSSAASVGVMGVMTSTMVPHSGRSFPGLLLQGPYARVAQSGTSVTAHLMAM